MRMTNCVALFFKPVQNYKTFGKCKAFCQKFCKFFYKLSTQEPNRQQKAADGRFRVCFLEQDSGGCGLLVEEGGEGGDGGEDVAVGAYGHYRGIAAVEPVEVGVGRLGFVVDHRAGKPPVRLAVGIEILVIFFGPVAAGRAAYARPRYGYS